MLQAIPTVAWVPLAVLAAVLVLAAIPTKPLDVSPQEAASIIRGWLAGTVRRSTYDAFFSCQIADPRVEAARDTFVELLVVHFEDRPPAFLTAEGISRVGELASELEQLS